jgi:hypothetical protein
MRKDELYPAMTCTTVVAIAIVLCTCVMMYLCRAGRTLGERCLALMLAQLLHEHVPSRSAKHWIRPLHLFQSGKVTACLLLFAIRKQDVESGTGSAVLTRWKHRVGSDSVAYLILRHSVDTKHG